MLVVSCFMVSGNEFVGLLFRGSFQRDLLLAEKSKEYTEVVRTENTELYAERQKIDDIINKKYPFEMRVFEYDSGSGLFIARGNDFFGGSGLVGTILRDKIEFKKIYVGEVNLPKDDVSRFSEVIFKGTLVKSDSVITCEGSYQPVGVSENYKGIWRLDSKIS